MGAGGRLCCAVLCCGAGKVWLEWSLDERGTTLGVTVMWVLDGGRVCSGAGEVLVRGLGWQVGKGRVRPEWGGNELWQEVNENSFLFPRIWVAWKSCDSSSPPGQFCGFRMKRSLSLSRELCRAAASLQSGKWPFPFHTVQTGSSRIWCALLVCVAGRQAEGRSRDLRKHRKEELWSSGFVEMMLIFPHADIDVFVNVVFQ